MVQVSNSAGGLEGWDLRVNSSGGDCDILNCVDDLIRLYGYILCGMSVESHIKYLPSGSWDYKWLGWISITIWLIILNINANVISTSLRKNSLKSKEGEIKKFKIKRKRDKKDRGRLILFFYMFLVFFTKIYIWINYTNTIDE